MSRLVAVNIAEPGKVIQFVPRVDSRQNVTGRWGQLRQQGMTPTQIGLLVEAVASTRTNVTSPQHLVDLVISGPEVAGVPTADTAATVQTLLENAQSEILLVGYAVHNGKRLFKRLSERMMEAPSLRVTFHLDIPTIIKKSVADGKIPAGKTVIHANTPSFVGSHVTGYPPSRDISKTKCR